MSKKYKFLKSISDTDKGTILFFQDGRYYYKNNTEHDRWLYKDIVESAGDLFGEVKEPERKVVLHCVKDVIHSAYSAAFELAAATNCKKMLSKFSRGMMHMGRLETSIGVDKKPYYDEDINHTKNFHIEKKLGDNLAKKIMNASEIKKWKLREEVWFDFKRRKQIFPDAVIMK